MNKFEILYRADSQRNWGGVKYFLYMMRKYQTTDSRLLKLFYKLLSKPFSSWHCLEIPLDLKVGGGLYIGHPYCITINRRAVLGWNINIHKGVTIGQENRGRREGSPVIGNNV